MPRIVIVDSQGVVREGVRLLLEQHPEWQVVGEAQEGGTAFQLVERLKPDLVVTEALLPRMSGVDLTQRITNGDSGAAVLILSCHVRRSLVQSALRAGARGFVTKQSSAKDLMEAVEVVLRGGTFVSPDVMPQVVEALTEDAKGPSRGQASLTQRERQVLQLIAEGLSSKEIGEEVGVTFRTVESYRASLMEKLDLHKVAGLVRFAIREGIIEA